MKKAFKNSATGLWPIAKAQWITWVLLALLSIISSPLSTALAQGTAFTYQGRLNDGPNPANGLYDLRFGLYDAPTSGNQQGNLITNNATAVTNGLFTVALDFGNQFPGADRWLEISARTNGAATFLTLAPRQAFTSTPYSIQSANAASAGSVSAADVIGTLSTAQLPIGVVTNGSSGVNISGTFSGNGSSLTGVALLNGGNTFTGDQIVINGASYNYGDAVVRPANPGRAAVTEYDGTNNTTGFRAFVGADGVGLTGNAGEMYVGTFTANPIFFYTADSPRMLIDASGNVDVFGTLNGDGGGLTDLNAAQLTSIGNANGGNDNFFVGPSGNAATSGSGNTANGNSALNANTSGAFNTANGEQALWSNTTGTENTANGAGALLSNQNGSYNTADGFLALDFNTTGSNNIALGYQAGMNIVTGSSNIDIGNQGLATDNNLIRIGTGQTQIFIAGVINGDGSGLINVNAGRLTSPGNTNGGFNNFFVGPSGNATVSGFDNTANGTFALSADTSGTQNTANGFASLAFNTSGNFNTANGTFALNVNTIGNNNTADGYQALDLNTSGNDNTSLGYNSLDFNASGSANTAAGDSSLYSNTNGSFNTAGGYGALFSNTSGSNNIALGFLAGENITTGSSNIDIGNTGLATDTNVIRIGNGQTQTFISGVINGNGGGLSNLSVSAAQLTSVGNNNGGGSNFFAGFSGNAATTGSDNTASGAKALIDNTSGSDDTADGFAVLNSNTSGGNNTAVGSAALSFSTSASFNTAVGSAALGFDTSGANNIALGYQAGYNIITGSGNIDIGNQGVSTDTNIIRIGSGQTQTFISGVINGNGTGLTGVALLNAGNTFTGNQIITNGALFNYGGVVVRPSNPGFAAVTEYDGTNNSTGFRAFVGADGTGITGAAGQMYVGTFTSNPVTFYTGDQPRMVIDTNGNVGIGTFTPTNKLHVIGGVSATAFVTTSDRNAKENFAPVSPLDVLNKVTALPIQTWNFKDMKDGRHMGPMAQDFYASFHLGGSDTTITTVDPDGVALAAIQGLNQKVESGNEKIRQLESENQKLETDNADLKARLEKIEQLVNSGIGNLK